MSARNGKPCIKCGSNEWYGHACAVCARKRADDWRLNNQDKKKKANRTWAEQNPEKVRKSRRKWETNNPEKAKQAHENWQRNNPDKIRERVKKWRQGNQEAVSEFHRNRRARAKGADGKFTASEWRDLCNHYGNKCLRCGRGDVKLTADHIKPLVAGGSNDISNIQPLCLVCNSKKKEKHIDYRPDAGIVRWIQAKLFG